jgi:hypothetical protein
MTAHGLTHGGGGRRSPAYRHDSNGPLRLGLVHFWLLSGILFGTLALVVFLFIAYLAVP